MMMKRKESLPPLLTLPRELIHDVLLRLPVKSLSRFKCVSKGCLSLISDPKFAEYHYESAVAPSHRLARVISRDEVNWRIDSVDTDASLNDNSSTLIFNVPKISNYRVCDWVHVVGACRGFLLLTTASSRVLYFLIWNPLTGFQRRFNNVFPSFSNLCGFGYDSSTDDYIVVMIRIQLSVTRVHCFSSRTNSWSLTVKSSVRYEHSRTNNGFAHESLLNGALHWLVYSNGHYKILAYNVMEKSLAEIPLPHELRNQLCHLIVMGGCLCIYFRHLRIDLWMMKEYKVQSSWVKLFAFTINSYLFDRFLPVCFIRNGDILGLDDHKTLVKLNEKGKLLEHCCAHGLLDHKYGLVHYRESLIPFPTLRN